MFSNYSPVAESLHLSDIDSSENESQEQFLLMDAIKRDFSLKRKAQKLADMYLKQAQIHRTQKRRNSLSVGNERSSAAPPTSDSSKKMPKSDKKKTKKSKKKAPSSKTEASKSTPTNPDFELDSQWRYRSRASSVVDFANSLRMRGSMPSSSPRTNSPGRLRSRSNSSVCFSSQNSIAMEHMRREASPSLVRTSSPIARTYSASSNRTRTPSPPQHRPQFSRADSQPIFIPQISSMKRESMSPQQDMIQIPPNKNRLSTSIRSPASESGSSSKMSNKEFTKTKSKRKKVKQAKVSPAELQRQQKLEKEYPKMISNTTSTVFYHNRPDSPLLSSTVSVMSGESDVLSSPGTDISFSHVPSSASSLPESNLWVNPQRIRNYLYSSSTSSVNDSSRIESPQTTASPTPSQSPPQTSSIISRLTNSRKRSNSWAGQVSPQHHQSGNSSHPMLSALDPHQRSMRRNSLSLNTNDVSPYSVTKWSKTSTNEPQIRSTPHRQRSYSVNMHEPMRLVSDEALSEEISSINGEQIEHLSPRERDSLTPNHYSGMTPPHASSAHEDALSPYSDAAYDVLHDSENDEDGDISTHHTGSAETDANFSVGDASEIFEPHVIVDRFEVRWSRTDQVSSYLDMIGDDGMDDDMTPDPTMPSTDIFKRTRRANSQRQLFINNDENNKRRRRLQLRGIRSHVNDLPDDLLALVLSFLGFMQRTPLSLVCKQWYHALKNQQSIIWRTINVDSLVGDPAHQYRVLHTILNRYGRFIQVLRGSVDISPNLELLSQKCKELREMHICIGRTLNQYEYDFVRHFRSLVSQNRHIRKVIITQSRPIIGHESIVELVSTCKFLRVLEIVCKYDMHSPLDFENDDESVLVDSPFALDTTRTIANKCFKLHSLRLVDVPVDDATVAHIVKQCFVLKSLDVSLIRLNDPEYTLDASKFFALPHVPQLKLTLPHSIEPLSVIQNLNSRRDHTVTHLTVHQHNAPEGEVKTISSSDLLHEIISLGSNLHCLNVHSPFIQLGDADMEIIARRLPNLCQLQILNPTSEISPRSLFVLIRFCSRLKVLFVPSLRASENDIEQFERRAPHIELLCSKIVEPLTNKHSSSSRSLLAKHQLIERRGSTSSLLNGKPRWNKF